MNAYHISALLSDQRLFWKYSCLTEGRFEHTSVSFARSSNVNSLDNDLHLSRIIGALSSRPWSGYGLIRGHFVLQSLIERLFGLEILIRGHFCLESLIKDHFGLESLIEGHFDLESLIIAQFNSWPEHGWYLILLIGLKNVEKKIEFSSFRYECNI